MVAALALLLPQTARRAPSSTGARKAGAAAATATEAPSCRPPVATAPVASRVSALPPERADSALALRAALEAVAAASITGARPVRWRAGWPAAWSHRRQPWRPRWIAGFQVPSVPLGAPWLAFSRACCMLRRLESNWACATFWYSARVPAAISHTLHVVPHSFRRGLDRAQLQREEFRRVLDGGGPEHMLLAFRQAFPERLHAKRRELLAGVQGLCGQAEDDIEAGGLHGLQRFQIQCLHHALLCMLPTYGCGRASCRSRAGMRGVIRETAGDAGHSHAPRAAPGEPVWRRLLARSRAGFVRLHGRRR